jgi:hypothetical protein
MQDIRALAAAIAKHHADTNLEVLAHAVIRSYAVDLLVNLANAIQPTKPEELLAVDWLKKEIIQVAAQIPQAEGPKQ